MNDHGIAMGEHGMVMVDRGIATDNLGLLRKTDTTCMAYADESQDALERYCCVWCCLLLFGVLFGVLFDHFVCSGSESLS